MGLAIKKAERKQAKLRLALTGPSGAGKTYSGLLIASGMAKKILVIDTENHSASLYVGLPGIPEFDVIDIDPPYTIGKYLEAIKLGTDSGYDLILIDSISHAWAGEGGLLEKKGALDVRGGNSYTNWAPITKEHEQFKAALLHSPLHMIVTMRSKQDYVLEVNDKGKSQPRKVGLAPIQRDGMEYEFDLVLDLAMDHNAAVSKTRVKSFDGRLFTPAIQTGKELLVWLNEGAKTKTDPVNLAVHSPAPQPEVKPEPKKAEVAPAPKAPAPTVAGPLITAPQRIRLFAILRESNCKEQDLREFLKVSLGVESTKDIPMDAYDEVIAWIQGA
jgi:hypothetical protein